MRASSPICSGSTTCMVAATTRMCGAAGQISFLDPTVVLPVMAAATTHLGLGATLSTSFHTAYHLARWLGSLDAMSGGRVAWNVVTSATELEARNAGMAELPPRGERYDRADEMLEACFALWNSWDADAFVLDKQAGVLADPAKVHYANYQGRWISTRGPLSIPRSPQGRPVIMQAGGSDRGREFAARWAEVIFTAQHGIEDMRAFYQDMHARMAAVGRAPESCAILPATSVVLGETESIARERADYLNSLIDPELNRASASSNLGADMTKVTDEASLAALQGNQGMKGSETVLRQAMKAEGLTLQQAAAKRGEGREIVGTAEQRGRPSAGDLRGRGVRRLRAVADDVSRHVRAVLPQRGAGTAAAGAIPDRVCRADAAGEPRQQMIGRARRFGIECRHASLRKTDLRHAGARGRGGPSVDCPDPGPDPDPDWSCAL